MGCREYGKHGGAGQRRAAMQRTKARVVRYHVYNRKYWDAQPEQRRAACIGMLARTRKGCSNPGCCGNPRRRGERTVQELRHYAAHQDQLEAYNAGQRIDGRT